MNVGDSVHMEYQGNWVRLGSLFIDGLIISAILGVTSDILDIAAMKHGMIPWTWAALSFAFYIAYYTYLEGTRGQTIGKMMIKIKVVKEDGNPIDMNQAFTRNILRIIDGFLVYLIGAILIWRSDKKQRLGDMIAKTVVVKA